jgi:hypothetical protein
MKVLRAMLSYSPVFRPGLVLGRLEAQFVRTGAQGVSEYETFGRGGALRVGIISLPIYSRSVGGHVPHTLALRLLLAQ